MTEIDLDKRFERLQTASDWQKSIVAQYGTRLEALEAEMRAIKDALATLIDTVPAKDAPNL